MIASIQPLPTEVRTASDPRIPFFDLSAAHANLRLDLDSAIAEVVASGRFVLGPVVSRFETEFARRLGTGHAIGVGSGTDALELALRALDLPSGSEVVTTPFTFVATASAIVRAGLRPVFADIDPDTWCLDPRAATDAIGPRTSALLPVHLFGALTDMRSIGLLAESQGLRVIEDAAQACGSTWNGRSAGTLADAGCFSFYPTKNLGAAGDAGAVVTDDPGLAERVARLRSHGDVGRFEHREIGGNHRLDAIQAAILSVKLHHLDSWLAERARIAREYREGLVGTDFLLPTDQPGRTWNQFCVRHARRDAVRAHLERLGIATDVYYPVALHLQKCFASQGGKPGDFPVAESVSSSIFALPIYPGMPVSHRDRILEALRAFDRSVNTRSLP